MKRTTCRVLKQESAATSSRLLPSYNLQTAAALFGGRAVHGHRHFLHSGFSKFNSMHGRIAVAYRSLLLEDLQLNLTFF